MGSETEALRDRLAGLPGVAVARMEGSLHYAWGDIRSGIVNTLIIDCATARERMEWITQSVFRVREEYPEIVVAFVDREDSFKDRIRNFLPDPKSRLSHYYRLDRPYGDRDIQELVEKCIAWHESIIAQRPNTQRYKYDVALSFAGEQRRQVEALAEILRANDVRVFYDSFEQGEESI